MSVLDYVLYSLILVLLVVYLKLGEQDIKEGYSPTLRITDEDSDLVMFIKYVFYFSSVGAYFIIKWPYQFISTLINIPILLTYEILQGVKPLVNTMLDSLNSVTQMISDAFMTMYNVVKNFFLKQFVNIIRSIIRAFRNLAKQIKA